MTIRRWLAGGGQVLNLAATRGVARPHHWFAADCGVYPRGRAQHDARIKLCLTPGPRMDTTNTAAVGLWPRPRLIEARLAGPEIDLVARWITFNAPVLLDFWNGAIDTMELGSRPRKLEAEAGR